MAVRTTIRVFRHMRKRSAIATSAGRSRPGYTRVPATSSSRGDAAGGPENTPGRSPWRPPRWFVRADRRQARAVRNVQRWMVERRLLEAHAVVGEGEHEGDQGILVALAQAEG